MRVSRMLKRPSASLPIVMSVMALAVVVGFLAMYGVVHQQDEGAAARVFQLLLAGQVPIVVFFTVKWLPREPKQTVLVLLLQLGAAVAALLPVVLLEM
jgi:hypothetical protein